MTVKLSAILFCLTATVFARAQTEETRVRFTGKVTIDTSAENSTQKKGFPASYARVTITRHKGFRAELRNKKSVGGIESVTTRTDSAGVFVQMVAPGFCYDMLVDSILGGIPFYQEDVLCAKPRTNMTLTVILNEIKIDRLFTLEDVQFDVGKSTLRGATQPPLEQALTFLTVNPTVNVIVVGNTDSIGTKEGNQKLSEDRARMVADWLIARGIPPSRLDTFGNGDRSPVGSNATENGRAKNRRVVIAISKK